MGNFVDHPNKVIIRNYWCKPIIQYIHESLNYKLVYLGLPGIEAIDLFTWIDYINYVIAIDCGDYSKNYDHTTAQKNINQLNSKLSNLERKNQILGYSLYLGYIEEVILKGFDRNGQKFSQKNVINIYNLDFCNSLTVPLKIVDLQGNLQKYYKNEVFRKLLEYERDLERPPLDKKFVMFVTIHTQFWEDEVKYYFEGKHDRNYIQYKKSINGLKKEAITIRLLRYYFLDIIKTHFTSCEFIPEFLPTILYKGVGNNKLMCFTIIGTYFKQASAIAPFHQSIDDLINLKFISPSQNKINALTEISTERDPDTDPINQLKNLKSIKELWRKN